MKKNDILSGEVLSVGSNGEGIVKIKDTTCFVPFAYIGEKIEFKVLKVKNNIAFCKLISVLDKSVHRREVLCPIYKKCGGCQLQHIAYSEQLNVKKQTLTNCLRKIAFIDERLQDTFACENEFYYRNKLQLPIREAENGIKVGFFQENSHRIVEIDSCVIQQKFFQPLISIIKEFISVSKISGYNEITRKGVLRHIVARNVENKLLLTVVVNANDLKNLDILIKLLSKEYKDFSIILNVNKKDNNVILGEEFKVLYGNGYYFKNEFGIKYPINSQSFIQVNDYIKFNLYNEVFNRLNPDEQTTVIDAYSGAGVMTAILARKAKKAIGIEIIGKAVESANELKRANNLQDKMQNILGDCGEILPKIIEEERKTSKNLHLVLDPPRKGCDYPVIESILKALPDKICYISCSPQTLSRDLGLILGTLKYEGNNLIKTDKTNGLYKIEYIRPYDMFPQTKHLETLVCLTREL